jgi:hypothetical protein
MLSPRVPSPPFGVEWKAGKDTQDHHHGFARVKPRRRRLRRCSTLSLFDADAVAGNISRGLDFSKGVALLRRSV